MLPLQPALCQEQPIIRLNEVMPRIRWNAIERGPLLVVGAERVRGSRNDLPLPGAPLSQFLPSFQCKLLRAGNMWVVGPESITALSDLSGITPEKLAAQGVPLLTLFNGFGPTHWKKLGSSAGLARVDLPIKLRPLFDKLLPEKDPLYRTIGSQTVPLSSEQRAGARLHAAWSYEWWMAPLTESEKNHRAAFAGDSLPVSEMQIARRLEDEEDTEFSLFEYVPNKLKPSDLDFAALEGSISLEGISTVQELVARIAQTTKIELYADARISYFSVSLRGDRARISDVLQALCLGVGGTVRQIGNAYLLTEERMPWFAQTVAHRELKERATALSDSARTRLSQKLENEASELRAGIPALAGEPHPDTLSISSITEYNAPNLPASLKRRINELLEKNENEREAGKPVPEGLKSNGVLLDPELFFWLRLPDYGNLVTLGLDSGSATGVVKESLLSKLETIAEPPIPAELKKPVRWPAHWKVRIARIAPKTPEEAAAWGQAARAAGFTELWVDIPMGQRSTGALIAASVKTGLPVTAVVSPLARPPGSEGDGFVSDLLASGETTDAAWKRHNLNLPEGLEPGPNPEPRFLFPTDSVISAVAELTRLPGVKGLALMELDRPGYIPRPGDNLEGGVIEGGGFVLAWRLAFLRRWRIDPADLPVTGAGDDVFEEHGKDYRREWALFRIQQAQRWRQQLHTRLRQANPQARIFIRTSNKDTDDDKGTGFSLWGNGLALPQVNPQNPYFMEFSLPDSASPEQMRWQLNTLIRDDKGTRLLCDLTKVSPLPYLKELRQPVPPTSRRVAP